GNVMGFLAPEGREGALRNIFNALEPGGRFLVGFGEGRGWTFEEFFNLVEKVGFRIDFKFSSWDLNTYSANSTFLVGLIAPRQLLARLNSFRACRAFNPRQKAKCSSSSS